MSTVKTLAATTLTAALIVSGVGIAGAHPSVVKPAGMPKHFKTITLSTPLATQQRIEKLQTKARVKDDVPVYLGWNGTWHFGERKFGTSTVRFRCFYAPNLTGTDVVFDGGVVDAGGWLSYCL